MEESKVTGNMTGRTLSNRYLVGERVGIGGMAEVYQGQDRVLGRTVAIKIMLPQYAEDSTFRTRFRQEAAAAANLQSPYIVNVYDSSSSAAPLTSAKLRKSARRSARRLPSHTGSTSSTATSSPKTSWSSLTAT